MPALDEFLNAEAQEQVDLFGSREVQSAEGGVKYATSELAIAVNGFYTLLKNIVTQGAVVDPETGGTTWIIETSPENRAYGAEVEVSAAPVAGLRMLGSGTLLEAEEASGSDLGSRLNGVPRVIGNLSGTYEIGPARVLADWHYVARRPVNAAVGFELPAYNYFNFGASYELAEGARLDLALLNAFQSRGLEEGNPRLVAGTPSDIFLARPLLPRRFTASLRYDF
jgi:outer membrane receptor protein involved in Fe transport